MSVVAQTEDVSLVSTSVLVSLPPELLAEVMHFLDWDDILRLRQVCKQLEDASYERSVWLQLFLSYSTALELRLFRLEKPLPSHSSAELERLVLRWQATDRMWCKENTPPTLHRTFTVQDKELHCAHLVRGGRWFLSGTIHGEIQYFDLDSPTITARTLIPSTLAGHITASMRISVDLDFESPYLSFNLAVFLAAYNRNLPAKSTIEIFHVSAECDSSSQVSGLTARKLSSFVEEDGIGIGHVMLFEEQVTYSVFHYSTRRRHMIIVKWAEVNNHVLTFRRRIVLNCAGEWMSLLPNGRFLCDMGTLRLFNIHDLEETTGPSSKFVSSRITPLCTVESSATRFSSPINLQNNSTRFLCFGFRRIEELVVDNGPTPTLEIRRLFEGHMFTKNLQFGYRLGVCTCAGQLLTVKVCRQQGGKTHSISSKNFTVDYHSPYSFVDDLSGRIIVTGIGQEMHNILEFGLYLSVEDIIGQCICINDEG